VALLNAPDICLSQMTCLLCEVGCRPIQRTSNAQLVGVPSLDYYYCGTGRRRHGVERKAGLRDTGTHTATGVPYRRPATQPQRHHARPLLPPRPIRLRCQKRREESLAYTWQRAWNPARKINTRPAPAFRAQLRANSMRQLIMALAAQSSERRRFS
jgi:hypothetical protein